MEYRLRRNGQFYLLEPWDPALGPALSYRKRTFDFGRRQSRPTITTEELFSVDDKGVGMFPAGLLARAARNLQARGHTAKVEDNRDLGQLMPMPDFTRVDQLRTGQDKILVAVAGSDGGQLVGGTGTGKSFLCVQICKMYPTLQIVIVSPRVPVVNTIYEKAVDALGSASVGRYGGDSQSPARPRRISVTTVKSMMKAPLKECDLLLFDEVHAVGCNQVADTLAYVHRARKFGFTATPRGRGDGAELVIEALFGPILIEIPYEDAVQDGLVVPIEVDRYSVPSAAIVGGLDGPVVSCKRKAYWRNTARNETIAAVARGVPAEEQVLIMTETLEHAILLHQLLPEYRVVHYGGGSGASRSRVLRAAGNRYRLGPRELDSLRRQFAAGTLRRVIATTVWREGVDFPGLAVLIRADGMTSPISGGQIPGRLSRLADGKDRGILVDFADEFSQWSERRAKVRFGIYRKVGWKIVDRSLA